MATPAPSSSSTTKTNVKLKIYTSKKKVLFAEAEKDFVDVLFGLLVLPIGFILDCLAEKRMSCSCSIAKVWDSVQHMETKYFQQNQTRTALLKPKPPSSDTKEPPHSPEPTPSNQPSPIIQLLPYFRLSYTHDSGSSTAPENQASMETKEKGGYVKENVTYMVMDNLAVKPMPQKPIKDILKDDFGVKNQCLVEKSFDMEITALKLVKASFESTTVLTDVLL